MLPSSSGGPLRLFMITLFVLLPLSLFTNIGSAQQALAPASPPDNASISALNSPSSSYPLLGIRQDTGLPEGRCTKDIPCANQACCNGETGECGFDPNDHCSAAKCTSKCTSKAECGRFAEASDLECPIHVCCSKHGFCGTTPDFCGTGCQSNCGQPVKTSPYTTDVRELVIGYVEAWAFTRRGCAHRELSSVRVDSVTHLYASFAYIAPDTYEVYPMRTVNDQAFFNLTNLKQKAPGLKVWIALGGWTYSDNDTDTQPVWGDLASTQAKREKFLDQLEKFMLYYGFDGVDYDWEYPGATDRGGKPRDGANYVELLKATRQRFASVGRGWGISFTAPSSLWYMKHFQIEDMMPHVDWVNLMTYDLFGSWDKESNWIGPKVYGHTNLTVIKDALNLLWRNNVPANQVNLGLGFYGRTYRLLDPKCDSPGCGFEDAGRAGQCSGQGGYMSYQDIASVRKMSNPHVVTDKKDAIKYFRYDTNQWVSYDDEETLRWKVEFANEQGLRGLFIWAITQDTNDNALLDAVLKPDGLGKFKKKNGVNSDLDKEFGKSPDKCILSDCDGKCSPGLIETGSVRCDPVDGRQPRKKICCPIHAAYDPKYCKWRANKSTLWCGGIGSVLTGPRNKCEKGEEWVLNSDWFKDDQGRDDICHMGTKADYCCAEEREDVCSWSGKCLGNGDAINCGEGKQLMSPNDAVKSVRLGACMQDASERVWEPLCCEKSVEPECRWLGEEKNNCAAECASDEVNWGRHQYGGGKQCQDPRFDPRAFYQYGKPPGDNTGRLLCCKRNSVRTKVKKLPVPLEYLFDEKIEANEEQEYDIDVDLDNKGDSRHPNDNSFGWHIMSGPPDQVTNLNKRDGSHWEVYGCDPSKHEGVQSARLVCTKHDGDEHNCGDIMNGGVVDTVLEMPPGCGAGKYALAISLEPIVGHDVNTDPKVPRLVKRKLQQSNPHPTVYNLTFDYGFHRLHGRADNQVKLRIDYSNAKDYWNEIVAAKPTRKRSLDDITHEVNTKHSGNWRRYLDHDYRLERRSVPLHELHERWYTAGAVDWLARIGKINKDVDVLDQRILKTFTYVILDERRSCPRGEFSANIEARISVNVQTSGVITLIGRLNDLSSFKHSYVNFRNKGEIKAGLSFTANGELRIPYKEDTLLGIAPVGASFKVPGVVTIGPEFKLAASIEGKMSVEAKARVDVNVASWDYTQRYPAPKGDQDFEEPGSKAPEKPKFGTTDWQVTATGMLAFHLIPMVTFGVVFDPKFKVPSAAFDLGVDTYARVHGFATIGQSQAFTYCVGAEAGYDVFARVTAPKLFKMNLNRQWSLISDERSIFSAGQCPSNSRKRDLLLRSYLEDGGEGVYDKSIPVVPLLDGPGGDDEGLEDVMEPVGADVKLTHEQLRVRRQRQRQRLSRMLHRGEGAVQSPRAAAAEPVSSTESRPTAESFVTLSEREGGITPVDKFAFVSNPFSPL